MKNLIDRFNAWARVPTPVWKFWDPRSGVIGGTICVAVIIVLSFLLSCLAAFVGIIPGNTH